MESLALLQQQRQAAVVQPSEQACLGLEEVGLEEGAANHLDEENVLAAGPELEVRVLLRGVLEQEPRFEAVAAAAALEKDFMRRR